MPRATAPSHTQTPAGQTRNGARHTPQPKPGYCRSGQERPGCQEDSGDHIPALVCVPADGGEEKDQGRVGDGGNSHGTPGGCADGGGVGAGRHASRVVKDFRCYDQA